MPDDVILYYSPTCPPCKVVKPVLEKLTNKHGVGLKEIQVEQCMKDPSDRTCASIKYTPTLLYQGKEIPVKSLKDLEARIERISRGGSP